jgi:hypothetical protein
MNDALGYLKALVVIRSLCKLSPQCKPVHVRSASMP